MSSAKDAYPPTVSVVMSTLGKNTAYLISSVQSVIDQTEGDFEFLILFDGPQSDVAAHRISEMDERIKCLISKKQRGLARNLNIGIRVARGMYIARMDDDDISHPSRFSRQLRVLQSADIDVLGTAARLISSEGRATGRIVRGCRFSRNQSIGRMLFSNIFIHPSVMMRRSWARKNRYDRTIDRGQDRELWLRAAQMSKYANIAEPLLDYRWRAEQSRYDLNKFKLKLLLARRIWPNTRLVDRVYIIIRLFFKLAMMRL